MFNKKIHKRIKITLIIIIFCFILILGKIFYIQVIDYNKLNHLANNLWNRNLTIGANRGKIITSDNIVIADNLTTVSLAVIPNQIKNKENLITNIANILKVDASKISEHVNKKSSIEIVHPEGRQLSFDIADQISALKYDGVYLLKEGKRYYPYGSLLSHSLGYVGIDNQGLSGLELTYDKYLTGKSGAIKYYSDAKGNRLEKSSIYEEPQNGMDLYLTINYDIQAAVERELNNVMDKYNADGAWAIVMNPNNGEILALASKPDFNSSKYNEYTTEVINRNHAVWATYEPGSTFKIITLAASIEENTVDLINDTFHDSGSVNVEGARIKCWKAGGHGSQTYLQVVQNSCNPGFVSLGNKLGKTKLYKYINEFGFGQKTGIDLNGESKGILFNLDNVGPVELATTAFGQGISVTAIQQITAVSAAINGGTLYKPYIVKRIVEPNTQEIIQENKPQIVKKVIKSETSRTVRSALETVVAYGTGRNAYIEGYRIGGKTGTAQKVKNGIYLSGNYILSFIGFIPADNPQAVVYVAVDNPKGITQYGGTVHTLLSENKNKPLFYKGLQRILKHF